VETFGTTAAELLRLREWLEGYDVTDVAMESTGVDWKPICYVLEEAFTCRLINAAHIKQVPGRKTDVQDCVWIAQLLEHGLLRGSFVPPLPIRELRDLTRGRKALIQDRTRAANRLHKMLEDSGIKLASVATDILGVSGRAILEALVGGTTDPTSWRISPAASCAKSFRPFARPWWDAFARITPSSSANSWGRSSISTRRSRPSVHKWQTRSRRSQMSWSVSTPSPA